ncbi:hypothetical protein E2542_SST07286 [Spatholobus suberectus]|nr:hypothetical protein E2542_SST07286 [Spatholobus suberectus]
MSCVALLPSVFPSKNHNPNLSKVETLESFHKLCGNNIIKSKQIEELLLITASMIDLQAGFWKDSNLVELTCTYNN